MDYYSISAETSINKLSTNALTGLTAKNLEISRSRFGKNALTKRKSQSFLKRLGSALGEPMIIILLISFCVAFGSNFGKFLKCGDGDFAECFGILAAVVLSVSITLIMEGSSKKAFDALSKIYDNIFVKVIRDGEIALILQEEVAVGDIILLETGDKIVADGRLIESNSLYTDESALTGESNAVKKDCLITLDPSVTLAERKNMVYSGTFVTGGVGKMVVTAIGNGTEIGTVAEELTTREKAESPLTHKLSKLGKIITLIGAFSAVAVFILSIVKLSLTGSFNFDTVQDLFISCIILVVAAVPEGLPAIVAVSLALNMIKLAKENALIKKLTATETAGAVSVICCDKTGTLTENKMKVLSVCTNEHCNIPEKTVKETLLQNFAVNSTADVIKKNKEFVFSGNSTEGALIVAFSLSKPKSNYRDYRKSFEIVSQIPFSSQSKMMTTVIKFGSGYRELLKGAPEKVLPLCDLTKAQVDNALSAMRVFQKKAKRVICFAHKDYIDLNEGGKGLTYDGYAVIADSVRKEVFKAVNDCKRAGIKIKMLTGDNRETAFAIAEELKIATSENQVVNAVDLEKLSDADLKKLLPKITVVARSTPLIKLRIVRALKELKEVVAVTGDGINDAPAIKHADVGVAMGITGSEISKEAADVVLLDDSFSTIVKAVSFGRNVYKSLQRFILFQLSVNLSALLFVVVCAFLGLEPPFNTLQLLWINVIMDGPPALTLGLEGASNSLMDLPPVKKGASIVTKKMLWRIILNGSFIALVLLTQRLFNFLGAVSGEQSSAIFTLFVLFQLFNAFNSRELGAESVFRNIGKNKIMIITFALAFVVQIFMVQVAYSVFGVSPMSFTLWLKVLLVAFSVIALTECYKLIYRAVFTKKYKNIALNS